MNEQICVRCRHFSPAHTCIEKPAWGLCMWSVPDSKDGAEPQGRFTWADDTCKHFASKQAFTARS